MYEAMGNTNNPMVITQSEFTRRMKDMSAIGGGMDFYGNLPDRFNLVVNSDHPLVTKVLEDVEKKHQKDLKGYNEKLNSLNKRLDELRKNQEGKKDEEIPQEEKDQISDVEKKVEDINTKTSDLLKKYGKNNALVCQLIDLALLSNNMLKGENLTKFVKRSIELI